MDVRPHARAFRARIASVFLFVGVSAGLASAPRLEAQALDRLTPELELRLALSALPAHLQERATVYLLGDAGYEVARQGDNGFSCMVRESGVVPGRYANSAIPICFDAEGSRTVLVAVLQEVELLQKGVPPEEVAETIASNWEKGIYEVPGPGISYMLSAVFYLNGQYQSFPPHLMFYAPYKHDPDVGANEDPLDPIPFIQAPGLPSAVMVVPAGKVEAEAMTAAQRDLVAAVRARLKETGGS